MRITSFPVLSETVATILLGFLGSLLVGTLLAGRAVLDWTSPAFQYLVFGAGTAVLFVVWKRKGFWESTVYALSFALYCAIPTRDFFLTTFINTGLFFLFACCSFPLAWNILSRHLRLVRFVVLALLFSLFEVIKTPLMAIIVGSGDLFLATSVNTILAGTIGLGVGAGIEIAEGIFHSPWMKHKDRTKHSPT